MTAHALKRLNERYGDKFTWNDIENLCKIIKKGLYLEITKDLYDENKISILLKYNNCPLKLIYARNSEKIVTALPLDIDECNQYLDFLPNTDVTFLDNETIYEQKKLTNKFISKHKNKEIIKDFQLNQLEKENLRLYTQSTSKNYILIWNKKDNKIHYEIFSRKLLQRKLQRLAMECFKTMNNNLLKKIVLLYIRIFK